MTNRVKIVVHVPPEAAEAVRRTVGETGAGAIGNYTFCSFSVNGTGRYKSSETAHPYNGETGKLNEVIEERVEVTCARADAKKVIAAIRAAHPYEEPTYDIYQLIEEDSL